jgi:hypothetical protein
MNGQTNGEMFSFSDCFSDACMFSLLILLFIHIFLGANQDKFITNKNKTKR